MIDLFYKHSDRKIALIDEASGSITYGELKRRVSVVVDFLNTLPPASTALCSLPNGPACVAFYLGSLAANRPLILADPGSAAVQTIIANYKPTVVAQVIGAAAPNGYTTLAGLETLGIGICVRAAASVVKLHPQLALLLTTSGSTGNPKLVRLSGSNLRANACSIVEYLQIGADEVAIQSLPLHYSYGLSLLNSHICAGAAVAIPQHSFMRPEFWAFASKSRSTSFAGVPYMYETLHRLRMDPFACETLRTSTQAGGPLKAELVRVYAESASRAGKRFFVMYGQTEATARISYVPHDRLKDKVGYIGVSIPGGKLTLRPEPELGAHELVYTGPNVMLGYAESIEDFALGDTQGGVLYTGDLGEVDEEGFFRISGRLARFAKLFGKRVHLGDVENEVEKLVGCSAAAVESTNAINIYIESAAVDPENMKGIKTLVAQKLGVPPAAIQIGAIDRIPRTSAGKKIYKDLIA